MFIKPAVNILFIYLLIHVTRFKIAELQTSSFQKDIYFPIYSLKFITGKS